MKDIFKIFILFVAIIFISGCGLSLPNKQVTKCILEDDQSKSGYKKITTYDIYSKKDVVTKIYSKEITSTENTTFIKYFENLYKTQYEDQNKKYGGYVYNIKTEKDKIISELTIDYTKVNMKKFIEDNSAMKSYVNENDELTLDGAKDMYKSLGAECK